MMQDEVVTNKFKAFAVVVTAGLTFISIFLNMVNNTNFSIWMILILIHQGFCWVCLLAYLISWAITTPSPKLLKSIKVSFLTLTGPCYLILSFYAFYSSQNLHFYQYILSFLTWCSFFSISIYSTFKLILELSMILHKRSVKRKLTDHYKLINIKSID